MPVKPYFILFDRYELYAMCRLFHCSAGKDGDLPPFVDDMASNSYLARHCCPMGTYWDPSIQECQDYTECYDPDPAEKPCQYDFNNDFEEWLADVKEQRTRHLTQETAS